MYFRSFSHLKYTKSITERQNLLSNRGVKSSANFPKATVKLDKIFRKTISELCIVNKSIQKVEKHLFVKEFWTMGKNNRNLCYFSLGLLTLSQPPPACLVYSSMRLGQVVEMSSFISQVCWLNLGLKTENSILRYVV